MHASVKIIRSLLIQFHHLHKFSMQTDGKKRKITNHAFVVLNLYSSRIIKLMFVKLSYVYEIKINFFISLNQEINKIYN